MSEDEVYVACVCGALVKKEDIPQHVEDCLKDDLVKNSVSLKISKSRGEGDLPPKERHVCAKCMRCGYPMTKEGSFIAFYPSVKKSLVACCSYMPESCMESVCKMCQFPNVCHRTVSESQAVNCIDDLVSSEQVLNGSDKELKCRERKAMMSQFLECVSENNQELEGVPQHEHWILRAEIPSSPPCKQFHVALLPNYNDVDCDEDSKYHIHSLLLQILNSSPSSVSVSTQTDPSMAVDVGVQAKILGDYSEEVEILCISREDLCSLDPDHGGCATFMPMYFFNRYTGQCHEFVFRGCLGNKNQFETSEECESYCEGMALDKKPDCNKKADKGPCDGLIYRYYYDADEKICNIFEYGGCRGNANNFRNVEECMDTCYEGPENSS